MFISHLLATREIKADQRTEANEGREVEDKENVFCHGATRPIKPTLNYEQTPWIISIISWTITANLCLALWVCPKSPTHTN